MNTQPIEGRLRDALTAHAERFSASPDAWQRVQAKDSWPSRQRRGPSGPPGAGWLARHGSFAIPAAAAATVIAVALSATALAHGLSGGRGTAATPPGTATHSPAANGGPPAGPPSHLLDTDPATSAIFARTITRNVTAWYWIGQPSPLYWFPYIASKPEFCHWLAATAGDGSGNCWPVPAVNRARPAVVISNNDYVGTGRPVASGFASPDVTSVTAMLRDGQRFSGVVGTARGFGGDKAWSVAFPSATGTKLVFTRSDGQILTELSTAAPPGPIVLDLPQPTHGGQPLFGYPASHGSKAGSVTAYLVDGHVAFFAPALWGGTFSPYAASAAPAVGGMVQPFGFECPSDCHSTLVEAFGYAHGNVAYVHVRLPDGHVVTTPGYAAWPGSGLRLWAVSVPPGSWQTSTPLPKYTVTAYDAAGHVIGQARLGRPQI